MDVYIALSDLSTFSQVEGSAVFTVNEQNELRVYDLPEIIQHLQKENKLDSFLIDLELDEDILYEFDTDSPLTQVLTDGTREEINLS